MEDTLSTITKQFLPQIEPAKRKQTMASLQAMFLSSTGADNLSINQSHPRELLDT